jgi:uncharacterized membrane protein YhfC
MVSGLSIFLMFITLLLSIGFPVFLAARMYKKHSIRLKAILAGALMFTVFQMVLRLPLLSYFKNQIWFRLLEASSGVIMGIVIAFTAALFETTGRYIGFKFLLKDGREWEDGAAYGIGHGGIESILLVGIPYLFNIICSLLTYTGAAGGVSLQALMLTPSVLFLAAGVERFFTILVHIALSLMVLYGIKTERKIYILLCLLIHTAVDGGIGVMQAVKVSIWVMEAWVILWGLLGFAYIFKSRKSFIAAKTCSDKGGIGNEVN